MKTRIIETVLMIAKWIYRLTTQKQDVDATVPGKAKAKALMKKIVRYKMKVKQGGNVTESVKRVWYDGVNKRNDDDQRSSSCCSKGAGDEARALLRLFW